MKYYYDIYLNFNEYPIPYYEWNKNDNIERNLKIPVIKVNDIKDLIKYHASIDTDLKKIILTDGISCVALEIIDCDVVYMSYLPYEDEISILELSRCMETLSFDIKYYDIRYIPTIMRQDELVQKVFIKSLEELDSYALKYIYYEITGLLDNNVKRIKEYLKNDIMNNFRESYIKLYYQICKQT